MNITKKTILVLLITILLGPITLKAFQTDPTSLIFVRHVEKVDDGTRNPPISEEGKIRAVNLYNVLSKEYPIKAIYSTAYKRTEMSATPLADSLGLEIQNYDFEGLEDFLKSIITENRGGAVLIVGHSNTTPRLVNMVIGEKKYEQIDESEYGDIFIVSTTEYGTGTVELSEF